MKRVLLLVEGQTEETFVKQVLAPHFASRDVFLAATCVVTRERQGRRERRGGLSEYAKVRPDVLRLLGSNPHAVSTLFDYYGLPSDFPGWATRSTGANAADRALHIERAFAADISDARFIPNLVVHEFEALLFTDPAAIGKDLAETARAELVNVAASRPSPEDIDDGPETHPCRHIQRQFPAYQKVRDGVLIAERIGIAAMRAKCPHFAAWLGRLETLGTTSPT
jgi:hypothetical protein